VNERKRIDVVVRLVEWSEKDEYDRLGVGDQVHVILGQGIRLLTVPVRPGRDMGSILEIAARNELLRRAGKDSARSFVDRVEATLRQGMRPLEPESIAGPVDDLLAPHRSGGPTPDGKPQPLWRSTVTGGPMGTESSAWIPAVRPKKEDE
jgi:HPr kinase/phosphorylase